MNSGLAEYLAQFLLVCLVVSLVCPSVRGGDSRIFKEGSYYFLMMAAGIAIFSVVVFLLEWAFIRRPF